MLHLLVFRLSLERKRDFTHPDKNALFLSTSPQCRWNKKRLTHLRRASLLLSIYPRLNRKLGWGKVLLPIGKLALESTLQTNWMTSQQQQGPTSSLQFDGISDFFSNRAFERIQRCNLLPAETRPSWEASAVTRRCAAPWLVREHQKRCSLRERRRAKVWVKRARVFWNWTPSDVPSGQTDGWETNVGIMRTDNDRHSLPSLETLRLKNTSINKNDLFFSPLIKQYAM